MEREDETARQMLPWSPSIRPFAGRVRDIHCRCIRLVRLVTGPSQGSGGSAQQSPPVTPSVSGGLPQSVHSPSPSTPAPPVIDLSVYNSFINAQSDYQGYSDISRLAIHLLSTDHIPRSQEERALIDAAMHRLGVGNFVRQAELGRYITTTILVNVLVDLARGIGSRRRQACTQSFRNRALGRRNRHICSRRNAQAGH